MEGGFGVRNGEREVSEGRKVFEEVRLRRVESRKRVRNGRDGVRRVSTEEEDVESRKELVGGLSYGRRRRRGTRDPNKVDTVNNVTRSQNR